jgi:hypothetical protein
MQLLLSTLALFADPRVEWNAPAALPFETFRTRVCEADAAFAFDYLRVVIVERGGVFDVAIDIVEQRASRIDKPRFAAPSLDDAITTSIDFFRVNLELGLLAPDPSAFDCFVHPPVAPRPTPAIHLAAKAGGLVGALPGTPLWGARLEFGVAALRRHDGWASAKLDITGGYWAGGVFHIGPNGERAFRSAMWSLGPRGCLIASFHRMHAPLCMGVQTGERLTSDDERGRLPALDVVLESGLAWHLRRAPVAFTLDVGAGVALVGHRWRHGTSMTPREYGFGLLMFGIEIQLHSKHSRSARNEP